jgi:S-sulfosulfanyl-L-cysteine sulfohydrolase
MDISRRDFLQLAAVLSAGAAFTPDVLSASSLEKITMNNLMYDGFKPTGNVTLLTICDIHAHLKPLYWREPSTLVSAHELVGRPGFLCGDAFSKYYGLKKGSVDSYFDTYMDFSALAKRFGKMGGVAHIKTVVDAIRKERGEDRVVLCDSGDTWQGTAIGLKTKGEAIVKAQNLLGVDLMVGHWEFTYGKEQVVKLAGTKEQKGMLKADFISQNISDEQWGELVYEPYKIKNVGGVKVGFLGQSFPYTKTANPVNVEGWSFGLRLEDMQKYVNELKGKCDVVVLVSHDGFSVDQEVAKKVKGIDVILSGHTHDPAPKPIKVGETIIVIAGSHGKYVGRLDLDVQNGKLVKFDYKLIPIASNIIPADKAMQKLVDDEYSPFAKELMEPLGVTKSLLYKRDTFYSTFDALIGQACQAEMGSDIVFTPGFRWGTTVLQNSTITRDDVFDMTAITYPNVYTFEMDGGQFHKLLEDIADNVFNADPIYQQGGDMSRLTGVTYDIRIGAKGGKRISNLKVNGKALDDKKTYLMSAWGGNVQKMGKNLRESKIRPVYDITADYIKRQKTVQISPNSNVNILDFPKNRHFKG